MKITATEFKAKCLRLIDEVRETGEVLEISKHGRPVARVVPIRDGAPWKSLRGCGQFTGDALAPVVDEGEIEAMK